MVKFSIKPPPSYQAKQTRAEEKQGGWQVQAGASGLRGLALGAMEERVRMLSGILPIKSQERPRRQAALFRA